MKGGRGVGLKSSVVRERLEPHWERSDPMTTATAPYRESSRAASSVSTMTATSCASTSSSPRSGDPHGVLLLAFELGEKKRRAPARLFSPSVKRTFLFSPRRATGGPQRMAALNQSGIARRIAGRIVKRHSMNRQQALRTKRVCPTHANPIDWHTCAGSLVFSPSNSVAVCALCGGFF